MPTNRNRCHFSVDDRKRWMNILARSDTEQLVEYYEGLLPKPKYQLIQSPIKTKGRKRKTSQDSVTRCVVRLENGATGTACVNAADHSHAELAALFDALLQTDEWYEELLETLIEPLEYEYGSVLTLNRYVSVNNQVINL